MAIESIIEWIQTNPIQTEFIAIQLSSIIMLGYVSGYNLYQDFKERKDRKYTLHKEILETAR